MSLLLWLVAGPAFASPVAAPAVSSALGPAGWAATASEFEMQSPTLARVVAEANRALGRPPRPVVRLASAGASDRSDPDFLATREAFEDADDAVLLALAWRAAGEPRYRDAATERLLAWAGTNVPTGNPIDESRLDALVNAYELVEPTLSPAHDALVRAWLGRMRDAKRRWTFGPRTAVNNHFTHHLKMLVLLDRALGDPWGEVDQAAAEAHALQNLDAETGESIDSRERNALYYHAYDLDAWLEIVLATRCCAAPVTTAYQLLERRIRDRVLDGEFTGSVAGLDQARSDAGFGYGGAGSAFDPRRAEHAILAHYTGPSGPIGGRGSPGEAIPADLLPTPLDASTVQRRNLYAFARYQSWHP